MKKAFKTIARVYAFTFTAAVALAAIAAALYLFAAIASPAFLAFFAALDAAR